MPAFAKVQGDYMGTYEEKLRPELLEPGIRQRRAEREFHSRCAHNSKIVDGNVVRCGTCKKIVGFLRLPGK
jgi:hypothetical protein